jgi:hypothetical protein
MIIASIATVPERRDILPVARASLHDQVDEIVVYENRAWGELPGDFGKFYPLGLWAGGAVPCDYLLLCDDDIIYPSTYVEEMTWWSATHDCVTTCHGRTFEAGEQSSY